MSEIKSPTDENLSGAVKLRAHSVKMAIKSQISVEKPYICNECQYHCTLASNLEKHMLIHRGKKPFSCDKCQYRSTQASNLNTHMRKHSGEKLFKCDQCDYSCVTAGNMRKHGLSHSGVKPFTCKECNYSCTRIEYLMKHMLNCCSEKLFKCEQCDYLSVSCQNMEKHDQMHKRGLLKARNLQSSLKMAIEQHVFVNRKVNYFACNHCDYSTNNGKILKSHIQVHSMNTAYNCNQSEYKGKDETSRRSHMLSDHIEKVPLDCYKCQFRAQDTPTLKKHLTIHYGRKTYTCNQCKSYFFASRWTLMRHMRVHGKKKHLRAATFNCGICEYSFTREWSLKRHKRIHESGQQTKFPSS